MLSVNAKKPIRCITVTLSINDTEKITQVVEAEKQTFLRRPTEKLTAELSTETMDSRAKGKTSLMFCKKILPTWNLKCSKKFKKKKSSKIN